MPGREENPQMGLADLIRMRGDGSLLRLIGERFRREEQTPPLRDGDRIRVSSLGSLCPREEVLCSLKGLVRTNVVEPDLMLTFLHGEALHWALQNRLLPDLGVLYGVWRCLSCGHEYGQLPGTPAELERLVKIFDPDLPKSLSLRPELCFRCGTDDFLFMEQHIIDHELRLQGHPDGFLQLPGLPGLGLLEAKSISERGFRDVQRTPLVAHVIQVHGYFLMTPFQWAKVLYWAKGPYGVAALKEHLVQRDEALCEKLRGMLRAVWKGLDSGELPDRVCSTPICPRASACSVGATCFDGVAAAPVL